MKNSKVDDFVRFVVGLGITYDVDDDGYINQKGDDNQPAFLKVDGKLRQLMIIKDVIKDPDVIVINPMNENVTDSPDIKWVYTSMSAGLSHRILMIARHLHFIISMSKKGDEDIAFTTEELNFAAKHKDFNDKSMELVELLAKKMLSFTNVGYDRRQKKATLRCSIYDPDTPAEFPQFRNNVWKSVAAFFGDLLGIGTDIQAGAKECISKFSFTSALINVPRLESVLNVYYKIYTHINQYLIFCNMEDPDFVIDLTDFGYHIENLQEYYNKTKWFTGAVTPPERPGMVNQSIVNAGVPQRAIGIINPVEQSNIPLNQFRMQQQGQFQQYPNFQQYQPVIDYSRQQPTPQYYPQPFQQPMQQVQYV